MKTTTLILSIVIFALCGLSFNANAQNVAITDDDAYNADSSAMLDVKSTTKGMLVPRLTTAQRLLISTPATGLLVFDTNEGSFFFYNGTAWANLSSGGDAWTQTGSNIHLTDSSNNVGVGTSNPQNKFIVKGDSSSGVNEAIFAVVNATGDTIFAAYPQGARIYVDDSPAKASGSKGGFAVGGFSPAKAGVTNEYLRITPDSIRMYVEDDPLVKASGSKGGFAVGGFSPAKAGVTNEYLRVTPDSVRIYIEENSVAKASGSKGGFAVGGFSPAKTLISDYLSVNSDSIKASKSLYIPRMTTTERDNLGFVPSEALIIFNTTDKCMQIYENSVWSNIWCFNCAAAIIIQPINDTICSGDTSNFTVTLTGTNLVYQWQESTDGGSTWNDINNGGLNPTYSGAKLMNLSLANVPVSFNGYKYRCNISASCPPSVTSSVVTLNVGSTPPTITEHPSNQSLSQSCTASFSITSQGYGVTYQWQASADGITWSNISNGGSSPVYSGTTSDTVSLSNVPLAYNNEQYRCIASNSCGADATSNPATLTVTPITISTQPVNQQLSDSYTATFSVTSSGPSLIYQWQQSSDDGATWTDITNGGSNPVYSGATLASLSMSSVPLSYNAYKFRCIISHFCRPSVTSDAATLTISLATLTTTAVSGILSTQATSGGNISSNGGAAVTARGVCWSTSTNPTIADNITSNGTGTGSFTSSITSLTPGITYYVRAYAINAIGTAYGNERSFYTNTVDVGQSYQGGIVAYILQTGNPGYIAGQTHGLIAAPSDQSTGTEWGCYGTTLSGADGTAIGTGAQNTIDIVSGCATAGIAAYIADNLTLGGYSDWYLPSKNELSILYINRGAIGGFSSTKYYWSSSEYSGIYAWRQSFLNGTQWGYNKNANGNVRCVRSF